MTILTRAQKGSALSHAEMDENITDLRDGVNIMVPSQQNKGVKVDSLGTPSFGWHDLHGQLTWSDNEVDSATLQAYNGFIKQLKFSENKNVNVCFHLPHDYNIGSDLFFHVHWSHASSTVTGGSVTWAFEMVGAKGHNQGAFFAPKTISIVHNASTTQYQHMIAETSMSVSGGSLTEIDTDTLEPDYMIFGRLYLDSNDITDSVIQPDVFVHFVDLHYQSTAVPTKNKTPNFWT